MISIICWQIVYISKTVAIFMTDPVSSQKSGKGGGGLDDKSKPGIWFLNQFKTDAMATFSFLTDSYLHLGQLAYFSLSNPVIGLHGLFDFCFVLAG